jgi:hypothetical protein
MCELVFERKGLGIISCYGSEDCIPDCDRYPVNKQL